MYSKENIKEACKKSGINSVATATLLLHLEYPEEKERQISFNSISMDGLRYKRIDNTRYLVSETGIVFNEKFGRSVKQSKKGSYMAFTLPPKAGLDGLKRKQRKVKVHIEVAKAFVDNPEQKPFVNHIDGNPLNNHYTNLEWVTTKENNIHKHLLYRKENGAKSPRSKITIEQIEKAIQLRKMSVTYTEIERILGVDKQTIIASIQQHRINNALELPG